MSLGTTRIHSATTPPPCDGALYDINVIGTSVNLSNLGSGGLDLGWDFVLSWP